VPSTLTEGIHAFSSVWLSMSCREQFAGYMSPSLVSPHGPRLATPPFPPSGPSEPGSPLSQVLCGLITRECAKEGGGTRTDPDGLPA
jgi:hypothetical protein